MPEEINPPELEVPNIVTTAAMHEARQGGLPSFDSVSELMDDLSAED
jgi:hypothetical protein